MVVSESTQFISLSHDLAHGQLWRQLIDDLRILLVNTLEQDFLGLFLLQHIHISFHLLENVGAVIEDLLLRVLLIIALRFN